MERSVGRDGELGGTDERNACGRKQNATISSTISRL